jgi:leader peptidase (prepilin peptidase) / N-methyltransferase
LVEIGVPITVYLVFVGLLIGSFINLAADRIPRGESVVRPRSHCRECGRELNAVDLMPVLGYLLRRGRCASCGTPIGVAAPIVEATAGVLMLMPLLWRGLWPGAVIGFALVSVWGAVVTTVAARRFAGERAR